jgi:phospholipid:diacylglycerol acyltransferase
MSFLRRRLQREESSSQEKPDGDATHLRVVPADKLETLKKPKNKRKNFWIFTLGGVFGLFVAAFFAQSNDMIDLSGLENMNLDNLRDILPAAFIRDAAQMQVCKAKIRISTERTLILRLSRDMNVTQ